jgi:anti-anti-sigma regulatory factor
MTPMGVPGADEALSATCGGEWLPAEELLHRARAACGQERDLLVDVSGVDALDVATLQILLSLQMLRKKHGRTASFANLSPGLAAALRRVGAAVPLGLEQGDDHV